MRKAAGVAAGAVVWAALWVTGWTVAQALWPAAVPAGARLTTTTPLLWFVAYSVLLSVLAGYIAAAVSGGRREAVWWLAGLQLVLGVGFEVSSWEMTPVWYHAVFLLLLVPATVYGGWLRTRGTAAAGAEVVRV